MVVTNGTWEFSIIVFKTQERLRDLRISVRLRHTKAL